MNLAIYCIGGTVLALLLLVWAMTRLEYRIGSRHLKIQLLGFTLRQISLEEIRAAHKRDPRGFAERWYNTFHPSHRLVTIERPRGMRRRYLCITPKNRYVFLNELRQAVRRVNPECEWANRNMAEDQTSFISAPLRSDQNPGASGHPTP